MTVLVWCQSAGESMTSLSGSITEFYRKVHKRDDGVFPPPAGTTQGIPTASCTLHPQELFSRGAPQCAHSSKPLEQWTEVIFWVMPLVSHFKKSHPTQSLKKSFQRGTLMTCCLIWLSDFSEIKDHLPSGQVRSRTQIFYFKAQALPLLLILSPVPTHAPITC